MRHGRRFLASPKSTTFNWASFLFDRFWNLTLNRAEPKKKKFNGAVFVASNRSFEKLDSPLNSAKKERRRRSWCRLLPPPQPNTTASHICGGASTDAFLNGAVPHEGGSAFYWIGLPSLDKFIGFAFFFSVPFRFRSLFFVVVVVVVLSLRRPCLWIRFFGRRSNVPFRPLRNNYETERVWHRSPAGGRCSFAQYSVAITGPMKKNKQNS